MKKIRNKKGFTVIELVTSFALISIIVIGMLTIALNFRNKAVSSKEQLAMFQYKEDVTKAIQDDIFELGVDSITKENDYAIIINFKNGDIKKLYIDSFDKTITYDGRKFELDDPDNRATMEASNFFKQTEVFDEDNIVYKIDIPIYHADIEGEFGIHIITLREVYKPELNSSYTVVYDANGGTGTTESQERIMEPTIILQMNAFTPPTGKKFGGWNTEPDGTGTTYKEGKTYTERKNLILYAIWDNNKYLVEYDANGGTNAPASQEKTYSIDLTLSTTSPTRDGYTFKGWSTSAAGTVAYNPGDSYQEDRSIELYAVWSKAPQQLALTFDRKAYYAYPGTAEGATFSHSLTFEGSGTETVYKLNCQSGGADRGWGTYSYTAISTETADVTEYNSMTVDFENTSYGARTTTKIVRVQLLDSEDNVYATAESSESSGTLVLDTSNLTGSYYLTYYVIKGANYNYNQYIKATAKFHMPILTNE